MPSRSSSSAAPSRSRRSRSSFARTAFESSSAPAASASGGRARAAAPQPPPSRSEPKGTHHMAEIFKSGDIELLSGKVAVLGYGSQGHAHALNLHESGVEVEVGLREDSASRAAAEEAGLTVRSVVDAVRGAQLVAFLVP